MRGQGTGSRLLTACIFACALGCSPDSGARYPDPSASRQEAPPPSFEGTWATTVGPVVIRQNDSRFTAMWIVQGEPIALEGTRQEKRALFPFQVPEGNGEGWFELGGAGDTITGEMKVNRWVRDYVSGFRVGPSESDPVLLLLEAAQQNPEPKRLRAISTFIHLGDSAKRTIPLLIELLEDENKRIRNSALSALGEVGAAYPDAIQGLLGAFENPYVAGEAHWPLRTALASASTPSALITPLLDHRLKPVRRVAASVTVKRIVAVDPRLKVLLELLRHPVVEVRQSAIWNLSSVEGDLQSALPFLIEALSDEDVVVRKHSMEMIEDFGTAAREAVPILLRILEHGEPKEQEVAARTLGRTGCPADAALPIVLHLLERYDPEYYYDVPGVFRNMGSGAEEALPVLRLLLNSDLEEARRAAARSLEMLGPRASPLLSDLLVALEEEEWGVGGSAASALAQMGDQAVEATPRLVSHFSRPDSRTYKNAVTVLASLGRVSREALPTVEVHLASENPGVRWISIELLVGTAASRENPVPALAELLSHSDADVAVRAAQALEALGSDARAAVPALLESLRKGRPRLQAAVARVWGALGPEAAGSVPALVSMLQDEDPVLRAQSAVVQSRLKATAAPAVPALADRLTDEDPKVAYWAAYVLGGIGEPALPALRGSLDHADPAVRALGAYGLGRMGAKAASTVPELEALLEREDPGEEIARALARIESGPALTYQDPKDWPMSGRRPGRHGASPEKDPPREWSMAEVWDTDGAVVKSGTDRNIKWRAKLGWDTIPSPVVSDGLVWVGTTISRPDRWGEWKGGGSLRAFRQADGRELWRMGFPKREDLSWHADWHGQLRGAPLVEDDRLWLLSNTWEVICLDIGPLIRGMGDPELLWKVDLVHDLDIFPVGPGMGWGPSCSIGGSYGKFIYVSTGNGKKHGRDERPPRPDAPALVCLDKNTGRVVGREASGISARTLESNWSSPVQASVPDGKGGERTLIVYGGGDGFLYAFDPVPVPDDRWPESGLLREVWRVDLNPSYFRLAEGDRRLPVRKHRRSELRPIEIIATPLVHGGRIYAALGQGIEEDGGPGRLVCVEAATGEIVWDYPDFGRSWSTPVVHEGKLLTLDCEGFVYRLDAATGNLLWRFDFLDRVLGSPLRVDGKAYVLGESGLRGVIDLDALDSRLDRPSPVLLELEDDALVIEGSHPNDVVLGPKEAREVVRVREDWETYRASAVFVSGVLYVASVEWLFAIERSDDPEPVVAPPRSRRPAVPGAAFVPTPGPVVEVMLRQASVQKTDRVYDLGSGDGRILIAAARRGAAAVGYEVDRRLVRLSREAVRREGLEERIRIEEGDLLEADLSDATVITLYIGAKLNRELLPRLKALKAGVRIVSHEFPLPGIQPGSVYRVTVNDTGAEHTVYKYKTPLESEPK